jgi:hypothetical protein
MQLMTNERMVTKKLSSCLLWWDRFFFLTSKYVESFHSGFVNFKIKMNVVSLKSPHVVRLPNLVINQNLTNLQLLTITSFYFYLTFIIKMCVCVCVFGYQLQLPKCIPSLMEELVDWWTSWMKVCTNNVWSKMFEWNQRLLGTKFLSQKMLTRLKY